MDSFSPKPILLAALGMFGTILFLMIAIGALGLVMLFATSAPHAFGTSPGLAVAAALLAALFFWLAYVALRSVVRRIKEAQQVALARRAIWEASFRASTDRGAGSSAGK